MMQKLLSDEKNPLFDKTFLNYKCLDSNYSQVRYYSHLLLQSAPQNIPGKDLLKQQITEVIKNAIKHGNDCNIIKKVHVWYAFTNTYAHLIVEDEGEGFILFDEWNNFNQKRLALIESKDFENLANYISFKTPKSDPEDGGNAMFAALDYWTELIYNKKRNAIALYKTFEKKRYSVFMAN